MEEAARATTRRSLLGRGLVLAGAVLGAGAGRLTGASGATTPKNGSLRLYGQHFHLSSPTHRAGAVPAAGDRHSAYGELLARPGGRVVGHFTAAHLTHDSPFAATASSLEIHTFTLKDGTIHGLGAAARGVEGHFVILGGTGRYAGAQGSYVARQHTRELGGNGTAEFHLTLTRSEAANGI